MRQRRIEKMRKRAMMKNQSGVPNTPTPIKQNHDVPRDLGAPVYRHPSQTVCSPVDASGVVPRGFYEDVTPKNV
jgi:hypothetical protein